MFLPLGLKRGEMGFEKRGSNKEKGRMQYEQKAIAHETRDSTEERHEKEEMVKKKSERNKYT